METDISSSKDLSILNIQFTGSLAIWEIPAFRGAIGRKVGADAVLFHHHDGDQLRYAYPLIQYKSLNGRPGIVCLGDGVEEIHRFFSQSDWSLHISGRTLPMKIDRLDLKPHRLHIAEDSHSYELSHWVALNQQNLEIYQSLDALTDRIEFLERKLTGNILAFAKGIGWHIDRQINIKITALEEQKPLRIKGVHLQNFHVAFRSNVSLPANIGLGGKVSVGMGCLTHHAFHPSTR